MKSINRLLPVLLAIVIMAACAKSVNDTIDDASITTRVKTAFVNDTVVGAQRIDVETFKGVVTLSGRVKTKEEEQRAMELARKIRGVVDVKSTLQIGSI
jgi:hyperosmotically inducible periplasmic protein